MTDDEFKAAVEERLRHVNQLCLTHRAVPLFAVLTDDAGRAVVWTPGGTPPSVIRNLTRQFLDMWTEAHQQ